MEPSRIQILVTLLMVYAFLFGLSFLSSFLFMMAFDYPHQDLAASIFYKVYALIITAITIYFFFTFLVHPALTNFYEYKSKQERIKAL